ncbi:HET-domain-containing protein [Xylariaceae sp. FL1019]|nr:HET-domain-containing protein [Xylariaceae sp. FL1019]
MRPTEQSSRCNSCRPLDLRTTLKSDPTTLSGAKNKTNIPLVRSQTTKGETLSSECAFCKVVGGTEPRQSYDLATSNFLQAYRGFRRPAYIRQLEKYRPYSSTCLEVDDDLFFFPDTKTGLLAPRRVSSVFNPEFAISWLSKCKHLHPSTCVPPSAGAPERVIDCMTRTVSAGNPGMDYLALSYVWGVKANTLKQASQLSTTIGLSQRLPDDLPQTIEDAITLTKMIGYRYIWIDMYCIDQADIGDKHKQVAHMDVVYACADATIIVAAGKDCYSGIPGIGTTPRRPQDSAIVDGVNLYAFGKSVGKEVRESKWWTRVWTFQEGLLSHRRLIFTESQAFFECNAITSTEAIGGLELIKTRSELRLYEEIFDNAIFRCLLTNEERFIGFFDGSIHRQEIIYSPPDTDPSFHFFQTLVRIYTAKQLSFDSDALNAFNAIAMSFARTNRRSTVALSTQHPVLNLCGVPFIPNTNDLQWSLTNGLLWSCSAKRRKCFPSWSWAEYRGVVDWVLSIETPHWEVLGIQTDSHTTHDVSALDDARFRDGTLPPQIIRIKAKVVKPEMWSLLQFAGGRWKGPANSPWGKHILASPVSYGFVGASADLLPYLQSGQCEALCAGSSRRSGTLVSYLVETSADGFSERACLIEMIYGWRSSRGEEAEREELALEIFLEQGTVDRHVMLT